MALSQLLVLAFAALFAHGSIPLGIEHVNIYDLIRLQVQAHRYEQLINPQPRERVCYEEYNLGCYDTESGPMSELGVLPTPPNELDTFWILFNAANPFGVKATQDNFTTVFTSQNFNSSGPSFFLTHGFIQGVKDEDHWLYNLTRTAVKQDSANVFLMSWTKGAMDNLLEYAQGSANTQICGRQLGNVASHLISLGASATDFHGIGHSLGSHVMGFASNWLQEQNGLRFGKITGMDPAFMFFYDEDQADVSRLDIEDADQVLVLHTNSDFLSPMQAIGHVDYYPNGGSHQPGCEWLFANGGEKNDGIDEIACSHMRAYQYITASSQDSGCRFQGFQCSDIEDFEADFVRGDCSITDAAKGEMGINGGGEGKLYLLTFDPDVVEGFCGQHYRLSVKSSAEQVSSTTYGSVLVTWSDGITTTQTFSIMEEDEEVQKDTLDSRVVLANYPGPSIQSVYVEYQRYEEGVNQGEYEWRLDKLVIEDGQTKYYVCFYDTVFHDRVSQNFTVISTTPCNKG